MKKMTIAVVLIAVALSALYFLRPPGTPIPAAEDNDEIAGPQRAYFRDSGNLPGVTWVDDIHPIFVRNECKECHTKGKEAVAEGFEQFQLTLVDPEDHGNAYYSYHELVYAEGPPVIQERESLRDGQCCWPRGAPPRHQRRIWVGHPERSALVRKLDRDYYDWREPPRFFEEGIALRWGLPMPMYHEDETRKETGRPDSERAHEHQGNDHEHETEGQGHRYPLRPVHERLFLHLSLWLGMNRDALHRWPDKIDVVDRALIRYWIANAIQLKGPGTGIEVKVVDGQDRPVTGRRVHLVGNFNSPQRQQVKDRLVRRTDANGRVKVTFPPYSVVSGIWHIAVARPQATDYRRITLREGKTERVTIDVQ